MSSIVDLVAIYMLGENKPITTYWQPGRKFILSGRGAWNVSGTGGTKKYKDGTKPGPYYFLGSGAKPTGRERTADEYAVWRAVVAYQDALNHALGTKLALDGVFGPVTSSVVTKFQQANEAQTGTPWGGIGPDSSKALLLPAAKVAVSLSPNKKVTLAMVTGTVRHESLWDAGAVGFQDQNDLGLGQINGPSHPDMTAEDRLTPLFAFTFIANYYNAALANFNGNVRDSVASYNLGAGGTRSWINAGRPDLWQPTPGSAVRDVKGYIDSILAG